MTIRVPGCMCNIFGNMLRLDVPPLNHNICEGKFGKTRGTLYPLSVGAGGRSNRRAYRHPPPLQVLS